MNSIVDRLDSTANGNVLRKLLMGSVGLLGAALVGTLGYRLYRTHALKRIQADSNDLFQDIDFEASLSNSTRPIKEIEEVFWPHTSSKQNKFWI